jgi:hypothetical protein
MMPKLGDALLMLAMLVWLTVAVGPWWLGVGLFLAAWAINVWRQER